MGTVYFEGTTYEFVEDIAISNSGISLYKRASKDGAYVTKTFYTDNPFNGVSVQAFLSTNNDGACVRNLTLFSPADVKGDVCCLKAKKSVQIVGNLERSKVKGETIFKESKSVGVISNAVKDGFEFILSGNFENVTLSGESAEYLLTGVNVSKLKTSKELYLRGNVGYASVEGDLRFEKMP